MPSAGSWGNANHPIPWVHYTALQNSTDMPTVLHHPIFPSKSWKDHWKDQSPLLSSLSGQISTRQDNKKRKVRDKSLISITLTLNIGLQQTFLELSLGGVDFKKRHGGRSDEEVGQE